jgi:hypothetical protein
MQRLARRSPRTIAPLLVLVAGLVGLVAPASPVLAANEFPPGYEGFHTYAEMSADVAAVAAAHPDIVRRFSIGTSHKDRQLWAAKISDNVATDEDEPEVLYDGLHHSDEHMGLEMTLHILHWLVDGYGTDDRITRIVDTREIWIIFAVNPDGTDTAPASARWVRGNPAGTSSGGVTLQLDGTPSGRMALVTGAPAGLAAASCDLDGRTTVRSGPITLPATTAGQRLTFRWLFAHARGGSADDHLRAIIEAQDGTRTVAWERLGSRAAVAGAWGSAGVSVDAWVGTRIRILFEAADGGPATTLEAGIDDVRVTRPTG